MGYSMKLIKLKLNNFRSYDSLSLEFSDNYNVIYGNNGEGKTNLVESIYFLALTKSFRNSKDENLIKKGFNHLMVDGYVKSKKDIVSRYTINLSKDSKKVMVDSSNIIRYSDYITNINVILFNPDDMFLLKDSPSERRKLVNIEMSKIYYEYLNLLSSYNKYLKMRNAYLKMLMKKNNYTYEYLDILTENLIEIGLKISNFRRDFINDINFFLSDIYKKTFGSGELIIKYVSLYKNKDSFKLVSLYKESYEKEIFNGKTLFGIHHDDFVFYLDKNKIKDFGSVGQNKNSILSFKLSLIELLKKDKRDLPILILDDLFSELDDNKINNILDIIDENIQVFITTTNVDKFKINRDVDCKKFFIKNKEVVEEN